LLILREKGNARDGRLNFKIQSESPFVLDATTLFDGRRSIVFDGEEMSPRKKRFWTLEIAGTVKFTLSSNGLKPDSRLTISGFQTTTEYLTEVYIRQVKLLPVQKS